LIDDSRTVREVVEEAVKETVDLLKEFEEINAKFGEEMSDDEMNALLERQGVVQEKLDHLDAWDLDSRLEMAMDALRCPPQDTVVKVLSGGERRRRWRFAACFCKNLTSCYWTNRTNHLDAESVAWLEHHLQGYAGTIIAVTHDRYFPRQRRRLDSGIGSRGGNSVEREIIRAGWSRSRNVCGAKKNPRASGRRLCSASWNGFACRRRRAGPKGKARINAYESLLD
jgi:hypothetical protein